MASTMKQMDSQLRQSALSGAFQLLNDLIRLQRRLYLPKREGVQFEHCQLSMKILSIHRHRFVSIGKLHLNLLN